MVDFVWDAVPAQRPQKVEKYDYPVVTMGIAIKGGARKFSFNKASQELLGIKGEGRVSFGFNTNSKIVAVRKAEGEAGLRLTKTCTTSDKRTYDFMSKLLELSNDVENEFKIVSDLPGLNTLVLMKEESSMENYQEDADEVENEKEVLEDSTGNVDYPTVDEKLEEELTVTPSEDVSNNQW